jgi:heme A synthase
MFKSTVFVSNLLMSLMAWRGIRCMKEQYQPHELPKLAAVYLESFPMAASVLLVMLLIMMVQTKRGPQKTKHPIQGAVLIALQAYALIGVSGLFVSVLDQCLMLRSGH